MPKSYLFLLLFLTNFLSFAQNNLVISGKILDKKNQLPLESATVYLSSVKDSTVIDYTITDKNGVFKLETKKITKPIYLKISFLGYQTYKQEIKEINENINFGVLYLEQNTNTLNEVVIKGEVPPIRIKKDTLEFNASSFKIRPDANVETLLKQLPGVEVGLDGKITVNGKEVNNILVNGKPFFDKDGKIALQNLPSDIINKVQITDTKTKKEELAGQAASSNNASINLTIDENKNKGFFGKIMGGLGSDNRYESSGLANYFKDKRKISVLASSNNINSTGFSMDEIFDNMGGGRNTNTYYNSDGSFGINGRTFGGGRGITRSDMIGINYTDNWSKKLETTGSYFFTDKNSKNTNRTNQINFLPNGNFITESNGTSDSQNFNHNFSYEFEYNIDSTATLVIAPSFMKFKSKSRNLSTEKSLDENNQLLNESSSNTFDEGDANSLSNSVNYNKNFKRKGRSFNASFENENKKEISSNLNQSSTVFYQNSQPNDDRNQIFKNRNIGEEYKAEIEYNEPLRDSLSLKMGLSYNRQKSVDDTKTLDFNTFNQVYDIENSNLTNYLTSATSSLIPSTGINISKKKYSLSVIAGTEITKFENYSLYLNNETKLNKTYLLPNFNSWASYNFSKSKSFWINYSYNTEFPIASQVLPVENLASPLNTFIGNPDLDPNKSHYFYGSFRDYNNATKSGYSFYGGGSYFDNQVVSSTTFDQNRKRTTTYENISGNYNSWMGANWNKTIKKEANTFKISFGLGSGINLNKGFTNGEIFEAKSYRLSPRMNFTCEYGELLTINPSYNLTYNETKYTNYLINSASNIIHKFNLQTTSYWPKNWVFGNDFGYTFNSNIADGFKKDFYLWNTSLSYSFYNKKIMTKVKVYDLLDQNQSATRTISPTTIRDEENIVLKRYVMFSLTYKIEKFAGKEKPSRNRMMF